MSRNAALRAAEVVRFEENLGQADPRVRFLAHAPGQTIACGPNDLLLTARRGRAVRMTFPGASPSPVVEGLDPTAATANYIVGNDPAQWRTGARSFGRVRYRDLYPGVDLHLYGNGADLEYDFVLAESVDSRAIRVRFAGARAVRVDDAGDLVVVTDSGEARHRAPTLYEQSADGSRRRVAGRFAACAVDEVAFVVGARTAGAPLVLDPVLAYSSYIGGEAAETGTAIAVDASGNVYVAGITASVGSPERDPLEASTGGIDVFVVKLDRTGALVYSTYVGGSDLDLGLAIAVSATGEAVVTGQTYSRDFPTVNATFPGDAPIDSNGFLLRLTSSGDGLVFSTYIGGDGYDYGRGVAVDAAGNAYVAGDTSSTDFVSSAAAVGALGLGDIFVAKVDAAGRPLFLTALGGSSSDHAGDIAVDAANRPVVAGMTISSDYPTAAPVQSLLRGVQDAVVTKLSADGASAVFSTYLGGTTDDEAKGVDCGGAGEVYVAGFAFSPDFPTTPGAFQTTASATGGAFAAKLAGDGALVYATYIGGPSGAFDVAADAEGNAVVVGTGGGPGFPLLDSIKDRSDGDGFVAKLDPSGSALGYSTLVGGGGSDTAYAVAVGPDGVAYVTGETRSPNFPVTENAAQPEPGSLGDTSGFVVKVVDAPNPCRIACPEAVVATADRLDGTVPSAAVELPEPAVSGDCSDARVSCTRRSGDVFGEGVTSVLCQATGPEGIESVCAYTVTVDVPFGFCVSDDRAFRTFSQVVDPSSPLVGYWRYQIVTVTTSIVTYSGVAEQLVYNPRRRLVSTDADDPAVAMTARADFRTGRCRVTLLDRATGFTSKLRSTTARPDRCACQVVELAPCGASDPSMPGTSSDRVRSTSGAVGRGSRPLRLRTPFDTTRIGRAPSRQT